MNATKFFIERSGVPLKKAMECGAIYTAIDMITIAQEFYEYKRSSVRVLSTQDGDWEALFIDGKLIDQGHVLGDGGHKTYLLEKAEQYGFKCSDIQFHELTDEDDECLCDNGKFPYEINKLKGDYNN